LIFSLLKAKDGLGHELQLSTMISDRGRELCGIVNIRHFFQLIGTTLDRLSAAQYRAAAGCLIAVPPSNKGKTAFGRLFVRDGRPLRFGRFLRRELTQYLPQLHHRGAEPAARREVTTARMAHVAPILIVILLPSVTGFALGWGARSLLSSHRREKARRYRNLPDQV
jgi:hypothetical protein